MISAGNQPYFFPYIGYFQLLECSDIFVIGDNFQYRHNRWVNRNRILINHAPFLLTFPVQKASGDDLFINQRYYVGDKNERDKILYRIYYAYQKAPYFREIYPIVSQIMEFNSDNVSDFNTNLIQRLADLLEIKCQILLSSKLEKNNLMKGQDRVIELCRCLGSSHYVNSIGGTLLYQEHCFAEYGIKLSFLRPQNIQYPQFAEPFVPSLSIIDVLMFNGVQNTSKLLKKYDLLKPGDCRDGDQQPEPQLIHSSSTCESCSNQ